MIKRKQKVGKKVIASASTALLFGTILGLLQTAILSFAAKPLLYAMGLKHVTSFFSSSTTNITLMLINTYFKYNNLCMLSLIFTFNIFLVID